MSLPRLQCAVTTRLWCSYHQTLITRTQGCVLGLSLPRTTTHLLAFDHKTHQGVHGNQEGQNVERGVGAAHVIHDSADEKRNKAHLEIKQEGNSADGKGYSLLFKIV